MKLASGAFSGEISAEAFSCGSPELAVGARKVSKTGATFERRLRAATAPSSRVSSPKSR
eukprot:CAMPEP_0176260514 /NCGR_PEP_ID=MMETSP0121_2-20121125/39622_1 /TAXON_ID=160619 /ORGANISM="Kryptoperidinium foliaceum, Strain CCMP 1326" /LENGTH=58 /DNA_ID=CAMNT_0017600427 /DNA_START=30 /DNA_END=203 /DNA_ORIENTATION=-